MEIRTASISDMHGQIHFSIEQEVDILFVAGDILPCSYNDMIMACSQQEQFIKHDFIPWLKKQPAKHVVLIAGNHDWIFDIMPNRVPQWPLNVHYLQDSQIEIEGLRIYGTPQQPIFNDWAFNRTPEQLEKYYAEIPEGLDILLSHTAPFKIMDKVDFPNFKSHEGSKELKKRIKEVKPRYVIYGHFHGQYGVEQKEDMGDITFINCSLVGEDYRMTKKPVYRIIEK